LVYSDKAGGIAMQTMIVEWGNSHGIRIPKTFLQNMHISLNDPVDVVMENEKIIIKKANTPKHKTTKERLFAFYGESAGQHYSEQKEIDWGRPVGDEVW
jgi:antitoxin MazE